MQAATGYAHLFAGRYDDGSSGLKCLEQSSFPVAWTLLAASSALAGCLGQAQNAMAHALQLDPGVRISTLSDYVSLRRPEDVAQIAEGLRMAGLPV
jgi:hypothetical protein